jgi:5'-deoxynucleotidase YfbR-like HD superfamily hydrolase
MKTKNTKTGPKEHWMLTYSGLKFFANRPTPDMIAVTDIAHSLSLICRYNGHLRTGMYSVAQHCVIASQICEALGETDENIFWCLFHDSSEAYLSDLCTPVKKLIPQYKELEHKVMAVIQEALGIVGEEPAVVKKCDQICFATEIRDVIQGNYREWNTPKGIRPASFKIVPVSSLEAKIMFLERYIELSRRLSKKR